MLWKGYFWKTCCCGRADKIHRCLHTWNKGFDRTEKHRQGLGQKDATVRRFYADTIWTNVINLRKISAFLQESSFLLYRKLRFLEKDKNICLQNVYSRYKAKRQHDKTIRYVSEDIKCFFTKIVIKFIFIEEVIHIQQCSIAHGTYVLWSHAFGWISSVFLAQFLCFWAHKTLIPLFLFKVYHRQRELWGLFLSCRRMLPTRSGHNFLVHFFQRDTPVTEIQFKKEHGSTTFRAFEGIIAKRRQDAVAPFIKRLEKRMFFFGDGTSELLADWLVDTSFTGHAPFRTRCAAFPHRVPPWYICSSHIC